MIKIPNFLQTEIPETVDLQSELVACISAEHAYFSPKFLYDALGSKLFEAITCLPEYYPTRTEAEIMATYAAKLKEMLPHEGVLIDLGAGNCKKAAQLFNRIHPEHYVAIDFSVDFLKDALESLQREHPDMTLSGVGMDFSKQLRLPEELSIDSSLPRLFFYPGSSVSNFTPDEALGFLKQVRNLCEKHPQSGLLIGVDLVKDKATLEAAYDDALGVTAAFNKNALLNINHILEADFCLQQWKHVALFNTEQLRIEMHLESLCEQTVTWQAKGSGQRHFAKGERIHTENSYKWLDSGFEDMLHEAGFVSTERLEDDKGYFAVIWAKAN